MDILVTKGILIAHKKGQWSFKKFFNMFIMQYTCSIIPIIINIYFSSKPSWLISSSAKQAYIT